jgi:adenylate cyclase
MRAGAWSNLRDDVAAMTSWRRARHVADQLPEVDPDRPTMRIAPRTLLCVTAIRVVGSGAETGFEELRDLCIAAGDQRSLAIATTGHALKQFFTSRLIEASQTATELVRLLESIGDSTLTLALLSTALSAKQQTGEMSEVLRLAEWGIELAGGDPAKGKMMTGSPLSLIIAMRGQARCCLGIPGWRDDFELAVSMGRAAEPITRSAALYFTYIAATANGVLAPTVAVLREAEEALTIAEQSGGNVEVGQGNQYLGILLVRMGGSSRARGFYLLDQVRAMAIEKRYNEAVVPLIDSMAAQEKLRVGDVAGAILLSRPAVNEFFRAGDGLWTGYVTNVLVEALLKRGDDADLQDAKIAVDRLAAAPAEPGFVVHSIWLLRARALLANAHGDDASYQDLRDRYRKMAAELGFEGHIAMAEAMP